MLSVLFSGLNLLLALPESPTGSGMAMMILIAVIALRRRPVEIWPVRHPNMGDVAAMTYVALQLLILITGKSRSNATHFIIPYISASCIYLSVRLLPHEKATTIYISRIIVFLGVLLAFADLILLVRGLKMMSNFPVVDLSSLRGSLPLLGGPTRNDGVMIILVILPYSLLSVILEDGRNLLFQSISLCTATMLVLILILSFSRSAYVALAIFFGGFFLFAIWNKIPSVRMLYAYCLIVCVAVSISVRCLNVQRAVADTIFWNRTVSQQRSTKGREIIWMNSIKQIATHPVLGAGGYTDGYNSLARLNDSTIPFTARAYNAPIEAAISGGLLGLLTYTIFLLYPLAKTIQFSMLSDAGTSVTSGILACGIIALLIRDMTYSSLVLHGPTIFVTWVTVGLIQNSLPDRPREVVVYQ